MGNLQSSPTQTIEKKYEVFLNFRGADTRDGFTNYLYEALLRKSIETFKDEERIPKGNEIGPRLLEAIRESKVSVVIFSKKYASSNWCLRELVEIMKSDQTVIPVFYKVTVHDVRHQEGSFKDGFDQLEKEFQENLKKEQVDSADVEKCKQEFYEEMQQWRQALKATCDLKGWPYENGPESEVIDEIVKDIWEKLMKAYKLSPWDFKGKLFGIEERLKQVMSLLSLDNTDVRIIGIWGMGGIGKTTLADAIFHQISDDKYGKCLIRNVRQRLEQCGGLVSVLQQEVLSALLKNQNIKLDSVTLPQRIKRRLGRKTVFIVFDDVDNFLKLEELAGGLDQLGPGSRIIITTRNRDVLRNCRVYDDYVYEVKGLSNPEALQLFRKYAQPTEDLIGHSDEILRAIDGNPLGLKVAGSLLLDMNKLEWLSALSNLTKDPEILEALQISYDRLKPEHQNTFLDIACFYVGEQKDYVVEILGNCSHSFKVLFDRSVITISSDKIIEMHDLLQEMGREIVRKENLNNPGNRSRLWAQEDVLDTLKNCYGTNAIRGIFLNMSGMNEEHLTSQAFEKMTNLMFLKIYGSISHCSRSNLYSSKVHFPDGISYLSNKLKSLIWFGYPLKTLPSNFNPIHLIELDLRHSNIKVLREESMHAPKLKWIFLKFCPYLIRVSNHLDGPSLKMIDIEDCDSFLGFTSCDGFPSLTHLHLHRCNKLTKISTHLDAPLLKEIDIRYCNNFLGFTSHDRFPSVTYLYLERCNKLTQISDHLDAPSLEKIDIRNCSSFLGFTSRDRFPSLTNLHLENCNKLTSISDCLNAPSLEEINIGFCENLLHFPPPLDHFNKLRKLNLVHCKNLQSFVPDNISFPSLLSLQFFECNKLARISDVLNAPLLEKINLHQCNSLLAFPLPAQHFNKLREVKVTDCEKLNLIWCQRLQIRPNIIHYPSLTSLRLYCCVNPIKISDLFYAPSLEVIVLCRCSGLLEFSSPVDQVFKNLHEVRVKECKNLQSFGKNIHFPSLISVHLSNCDSLSELSDSLDAPLLEMIDLQRCSSLRQFPRPSQHFNSLHHLNLSFCKDLRSFPSDIHFPSLKNLFFNGCINLTMLYMNNATIHEVPSTIESSICKLKALEGLDLSDCSALECFPEILDTMRSLKVLNLSGTAIKGLHHSIENLSGLEELYLRGCKNLEMIPTSINNLTSLRILNLSDCSKLENLPGNLVTDLSNCGEPATTKPPSWRLDRCELHFTNCLKLNKTAVINLIELQINQHRDMTTKGCGTRAVNLKYLYPGSEVPGWFNCRTNGSSIHIQMSGHNGVNRHLIGFASCAVIEGHGYDFRIDYGHRCHCKNVNNWTNNFIRVCRLNETSTDLVALWYSNAPVLQLCGQCTNYLFEFRLQNYKYSNCRMKYCGVCPIYEKHNTALPSIANETVVPPITSVKEHGKIRKISDKADTSGRSNEDVIEPNLKRTCN